MPGQFDLSDVEAVFALEVALAHVEGTARRLLDQRRSVRAREQVKTEAEES